MVPSTVVMAREGSFALAFFGRVRKVQEPTFAVAAGRKSFALKRILEAVLVIFAWYHYRNLLFCTLRGSLARDDTAFRRSASRLFIRCVTCRATWWHTEVRTSTDR